VHLQNKRIVCTANIFADVYGLPFPVGRLWRECSPLGRPAAVK